MNITIISLFANAVHYLERYFEQMDKLQRLLNGQGHSLHLLLGYGDSTDGTGAALWDECVRRFDAHLLDVSHGGEIYGSIEHPTRFKQLAAIGNKLLANVPQDADVVGIVESDLVWDALTLSDLIAHLVYVPAIAPMVMDGENSFYDVWGYRMDGQRFTKEPPYLPRRTRSDLIQDGLMRLDSAGSVIFVDAELARKARFSDGEAIVGWCREINASGGSIWLDPSLTCYHPPYFSGGRGDGARGDLLHLRRQNQRQVSQ